MGLLLAVWAALWRLTDDASFATLIAFGPRWIWGLPLLLFLPRPGWRRRVPLVLGTLIVLGPIMGFVGAAAWAPPASGVSLRLVTANLGSRLLVPSKFAALVDRLHPDIVLMQECGESAKPAFANVQWQFHEDDGLCLASRFPVDGVTVRYRQGGFGHGAVGARYRLQLGDEWLEVVNMHLDTPRDGITSLVRGTGGLASVQATIAQRREQSRLVRQWLASADTSALVVAGDFNLTEESAIYRESWGHLRNAFSTAGLGWGYTKRENWLLSARIDHVLLGDRWQPTRTWIDASTGSDHRPLVTDLVLTP